MRETKSRDARFVHAAISTIAFPKELDPFIDTVCHGRPEQWATNTERLIEDIERGYTNWTAPHWGMVGDIVFFYHGATAKAHITHVRLQLKHEIEHNRLKGSTTVITVDDGDAKYEVELADAEEELNSVLARARDLADSYGGTLFACGRIAHPPMYVENTSIQHTGRIFADIGSLYRFANPLPLKQLCEAVKIGKGTITNVYGSAYTSLLALLARDNVLPDYLKTGAPADDSLPTIDKQTWPDLASDRSVRFVHESQLRVYLLDYVLGELKDPNTLLYQECHCASSNGSKGTADYFIRLNNRWIPVEAKLNLQAEPAIITQLQKYAGVTTFMPTKGRGLDRKVSASGSRLCLVFDQRGIYTVSAGEFVACSQQEPRWAREALNHESVAGIREELLQWVAAEPDTPQ
jgi:hypothetical protein